MLDIDINQGGKEVFITGHSGKDSRLWTGAYVGKKTKCSALSLASRSGLAYAEVYINVMARNLVYRIMGSPYYSGYEKRNELEDGLYYLYFYSGHLMLFKTTVSQFEYLLSLIKFELK
jgi:hypothetical protein